MSSRTAILGDIADLAVGMATSRQDLSEDSGGTPILTVRSLQDGRIEPNSIFWLTDGKSPVADRYRVAVGDLLVPARSTSFQAAIVLPALDGAAFNATLIRIRPKPASISVELLQAFFHHPQGQAAIEAISQSGTHQMNITVRALSHLGIPMPPIEQQRSLVASLDAARIAYDRGVAAAERRRTIARDVVVRAMRGTGCLPGGAIA